VTTDREEQVVTKPTEDELKELIRSEKPAFFAKGVTTDAERGRKFTAVYDGRGNWFIERPARIEFKSGSRTVLVDEGAVRVLDIPVVANNDVKVHLDGKRIALLSEGSFEVVGRAVVAGRSCYEIRAWGLKQDDELPFDMAVDQETGVILRMSKGEILFEVNEFRLGVPTSS